MARQAYFHLSSSFEQLNENFKLIKLRVFCPYIKKHASYIWSRFIIKYGKYYANRMLH
jgi:hypothetical protein